LFWLRKDTLLKPVGGNRDALVLWKERPRVDGCSEKGRVAHFVRH